MFVGHTQHSDPKLPLADLTGSEILYSSPPGCCLPPGDVSSLPFAPAPAAAAAPPPPAATDDDSCSSDSSDENAVELNDEVADQQLLRCNAPSLSVSSSSVATATAVVASPAVVAGAAVVEAGAGAGGSASPTLSSASEAKGFADNDDTIIDWLRFLLALDVAALLPALPALLALLPASCRGTSTFIKYLRLPSTSS